MKESYLLTYVFSAILMTGVTTSPIYSQVPGNSASVTNDLDTDVELFRFHVLETKLTTMPAGPDKNYFAGVLANRCGRIDESVRLLEEAIPNLKTERPGRAAIALETLADDYTKIYRYAEATKAYEDLLAHFAGEIKKTDLKNIQDDYAVIKLLAEYPRQSISMNAPIHLQTRRSPIGTIDTDLTINNVKAPWILDTGASFSAVTASFAKRLGVQPSTGVAQTKGTVNGINNVLHVGILPELKLGGATIRNVVLLILEDQSLLINLGPGKSYQIDAILGFPVFQILGSATFAKDGGFQAGFHTDRAASESRVFMNKLKPLIECSSEDRHLPFAFDTGADISTLSVRYFRDFPDQFEGLKKVPSSYGGAGGMTKNDVFSLPEVKLQVAGKEVVLKRINTFPFSVGTDMDDAYGNLGRDLVAGFESFTLDFTRMTFSLKN